MFCSSLRNRNEWATTPAELVGAQGPRWLEVSLDSHDLAIPLPLKHEQDPPEFFRLILLSSIDLQTPSTMMNRIERLYHKQGGRNVGLIFLINEKFQKENGTVPFMSLQINLQSNLEMPLLPLFSVSSLKETLFAFQRQLRQVAATPEYGNSSIALLAYCSTNPPIREHARNILSDICDSIPSLAVAATTPDGQQGLGEWFSESPQVVEEIIGFWKEEYVAE